MLGEELLFSAKQPSTMMGSLKVWTAKEGEIGEKAELEWFSMSIIRKGFCF